MMKDKKQSRNKATEALERDLAELTQDLKRVQADFVNYKRRSEDDKMRAVQLGKELAVKALLPVIDNLDRALNHLPKDLEKHDWAKGVASVAKQVQEALKQVGVEKIDCVGKEFDPNLHEAVSVEEGDGEHEVVVEELQPGYVMNGEVIRHSMVKVKKGE